MKLTQYITKTRLFILAVALALSLGIVRTNEMSGMAACLGMANCNVASLPLGEVHTKKMGYPLAYREVNEYRPLGESGETVSAEREGMSVPNIIINTVFWFALLELIRRYFKIAQPAPATTGRRKAKS